VSTEADVAKNASRIEALEAWQKRQNGTLDRLDAKIDRLQYWLMGLAAGLVIQLMVLLYGVH